MDRSPRRPLPPEGEMKQFGPTPKEVAILVETAPGEVAQVDFGYAVVRSDRAARRRSALNL